MSGGLLGCPFVLVVVACIDSFFFVCKLISLARARFDFDERVDEVGEVESVVNVVTVDVGDDNSSFFFFLLGEVFEDLGDVRLSDEAVPDLRLDDFLVLLSVSPRLDDELFLEDELAEEESFREDEPFFGDKPDDFELRDKLRRADDDDDDLADAVDAERPRDLEL